MKQARGGQKPLFFNNASDAVSIKLALSIMNGGFLLNSTKPLSNILLLVRSSSTKKCITRYTAHPKCCIATLRELL